VLPGYCLGRNRVRSHYNWGLPDLRDQDAIVVNTALTDITTQRLLRGARRIAPRAKWMFWAELIRSGGGLAGRARQMLSAPLKNLDAIVAIGRRAASDYRKRFPQQSIPVLPYFCNLQPFIDASEKKTAIKHDEPVRFLFCGQMVHRKGVDLLIDAFAQLVASGSNAQLIMVGREASLPEYLDGVKTNVVERIQYLGFKAIEELPTLFADADVFVLPSRHDGWGVVINQAIGAGLAVISSDQVGAALDLIENDINGLIVPVGDVESLLQAMKQLDNDRQQIIQMKQENRKRRLDLLPEAGAQRWLKILEKEFR